ncbi:hypothetical protein KQI43_04315 [Bacillus atrophaeus]|nr:hypothetical protein [Bacillus atrophaeus]
MKPVLTKKQADAIKKLRELHKWTDEDILIEWALVVSEKEENTTEEFMPLLDLGIITLAASLINGYEVEKTPEEKVREYFEGVRNSRDERYLAGDIEGKRFHAGALVGICNTLGLLGIKIEGVNA